MLYIREKSKDGHTPTGADVGAIAGRLACWWFLLTAIGLLWIWPLVIGVICYMRNPWVTAVFLGYLAYISVGHGAKAARNCSWRTPLRRWSLWQLMASYFDARLVKTADLDPNGHYLFAVHPHGIIAISSWINFVTEATGFRKLFPGIDVHAATLESNFRTPFLREYILLHGLIDAGRETIRRVLTGPPGRSVLLVVGGAAEALLAAPGTYDIILQARKGFVRLALQTGASLVPVIAYGETDTFHTYIWPPGGRGAAVSRWLKKFLGISTPMCWGIGVFGGWGMMPLQVPLVTVVGAPLAVEKTDSPTPEQVDRLHGEYVAAINKLWDETSAKYGKNVRRGLTIVQ
ncbi:hypothetical protein PLESTF_000010000 [Pleodorina starrii]|nr:hypothetical protein PLESTF_000010000 [Pleodorina starrii]